MGSEADLRAWIELEKTEAGNVGADIVVNPRLYAALVQEILSSPEPVSIADFGGGTGSLAFDVLTKDPASKAALSMIGEDLMKARARIRTFIIADMYETLLEQAEEQKKAWGENASAIQTMRIDLGSERLPLADGSLSLAVSRQFLMHLRLEELRHHFSEVHRVLRDRGAYLLTILNPERDRARYARKYPDRPALEPEQQYEYEMEHAGLKFSQQSTYRPLETYLATGRSSGFEIETAYLTASISGYERSHAAYYDQALPMAVLLRMKKNERAGSA